MNNRPVGGHSSETLLHLINMNYNKIMIYRVLFASLLTCVTSIPEPSCVTQTFSSIFANLLSTLLDEPGAVMLPVLADDTPSFPLPCEECFE
jgi:hypothetical protein